MSSLGRISRFMTFCAYSISIVMQLWIVIWPTPSAWLYGCSNEDEIDDDDDDDEKELGADGVRAAAVTAALRRSSS
jgi:hypothetical protein